MIYLMYWIYLMSFIYVIHLMCWNYLIDLIDLMDLITHNRNRNNRNNSGDGNDKGARASNPTSMAGPIGQAVDPWRLDYQLDIYPCTHPLSRLM